MWWKSQLADQTDEGMAGEGADGVGGLRRQVSAHKWTIQSVVRVHMEDLFHPKLPGGL